jgi:hypothetical protein
MPEDPTTPPSPAETAPPAAVTPEAAAEPGSDPGAEGADARPRRRGVGARSSRGSGGGSEVRLRMRPSRPPRRPPVPRRRAWPRHEA